MSRDVGARIVKNSLFNLLRTVITVPITLLLMPYIIRHLGKEEFGIWALVGVISSYAQLSDFGITESLIKFMAEFKAREDTLRLNQLINTALTLYVIISIIISPLFVFILPFVAGKILNIPGELQVKAIYVFTIAVVLFFVNMLMGVFNSLIIGFQRMGHSNLINLVSTVMMACGTIFFLESGFGLVGLIYNNVLVTVLVIFLNLRVARYLFKPMRINPFVFFSKEMCNNIFHFSWKIQVSNLAVLMILQIDRVLLSHFVGLASVSYYEVANRIASQARALVATVFNPIAPASSELQANDEKEKLAGLYRRSFKYMAISAVPFSILIIALAHPFVRTWIGPGYEVSAVTMQLLMAAYMVNLLTGPGSWILNGINKPHISMRSSLVAGVTNLVLCLLLVRWIGYYGIIIGIFSSLFTSALYFIWMVHKNIEGIEWSIYRRALARPLVLSVAMAVLLLLLDRVTIIRGYPVLCLLGLVYMAVVMCGITRGDYLDDFDRTVMGRLNPLRLFS